MKISSFIFTLVVCIFPILSPGQDNEFKYVRGESLTVVGRPEFVSDGSYCRIDSINRIGLPESVQQLSRNSAGISLIFQTNSTAIRVKWKLDKYNIRKNMTPIAVNGLDLYGWRGTEWEFVASAAPESDENEALLVQHMEQRRRHYQIYLPLYAGIEDIWIGVEGGASIEAGESGLLPFHKVIFYGSSITQGASASRPGLAYPAIISRKLGMETYNLGFSGSAKMEHEIVDILAKIPADLYVLDCVPNSSPQIIQERAFVFVDKLRKLRPETPILMVESVFREGANWNKELHDKVNRQNLMFRKTYKDLTASGMKKVYYISSSELLGEDHEATIDGTHLNDLGQMRISGRIARAITDILGMP